MRWLFLLFLFPWGLFAALSVQPHAEVALVINADTGTILYEKNSQEICYPASITKIATALYAAKMQKDWGEIIEVPGDAIGSISASAKKKANYKKPAYWIEVGGTHIGLKKGERLSFQDLMGAMMVASANDAANVIAYHLGKKDINKFVDEMNRYLKEIGCKNTHFCNPHGLFMPKHQTTAHDMALIARHYMKEPKLRALASAATYTIEETNKQEKRVLPNSNKLLRKGSAYYAKATGLKTGYTSDAGHTIVAAAEDKGRTLITVLMRCEERDDLFADTKLCFERAFAEGKVSRTLLPKGKKLVKKKLAGGASDLEVAARDEVRISYYPSEEPELFEKVIWQEHLKPGLQAGTLVGQVEWTNREGQIMLQAPLVAAEDVEATWLYKLQGEQISRSVFIVGGCLALLTLIIWLWLRGKKRTGCLFKR